MEGLFMIKKKVYKCNFYLNIDLYSRIFFPYQRNSVFNLFLRWTYLLLSAMFCSWWAMPSSSWRLWRSARPTARCLKTRPHSQTSVKRSSCPTSSSEVSLYFWPSEITVKAGLEAYQTFPIQRFCLEPEAHFSCGPLRITLFDGNVICKPCN